jgi:hypothetical protein
MTPTDSNHSEAASERSPRPILIRLGVALILVSGVLWFSLFAIPFLPLTVGQKTGLGAVVFAGVQIAWWSGAALAGPAVVKKLMGRFRRSHARPPEE